MWIHWVTRSAFVFSCVLLGTLTAQASGSSYKAYCPEALAPLTFDEAIRLLDQKEAGVLALDAAARAPLRAAEKAMATLKLDTDRAITKCAGERKCIDSVLVDYRADMDSFEFRRSQEKAKLKGYLAGVQIMMRVCAERIVAMTVVQQLASLLEQVEKLGLIKIYGKPYVWEDDNDHFEFVYQNMQTNHFVRLQGELRGASMKGVSSQVLLEKPFRFGELRKRFETEKTPWFGIDAMTDFALQGEPNQTLGFGTSAFFDLFDLSAAQPVDRITMSWNITRTVQ